jgi:hypothetical protein
VGVDHRERLHQALGDRTPAAGYLASGVGRLPHGPLATESTSHSEVLTPNVCGPKHGLDDGVHLKSHTKPRTSRPRPFLFLHPLFLPYRPPVDNQALDERRTWCMLSDRDRQSQRNLCCPRDRVWVNDAQQTCCRAGLLCWPDYPASHHSLPSKNPGIPPGLLIILPLASSSSPTF